MSSSVLDGTGATRNLQGWRRDLPRLSDAVVRADSDAVLLPSADLPLMARVPVYDQGQLGSCTANMGCTMYRYLEARAGRPLTDVSRLSLYKYTRQLEGTPLNEDSGAQIRTVFRALRLHGVALERDDPYLDDGRQFTIEPTPTENADAAQREAIFFYRLIDLRTIKASLVEGFGVGFGFAVYSNLMSPEVAATGELAMPNASDKPEGGHAAVAIGYSDEHVIGASQGALRIRNSWGTGWGYQGSGDFWMSYDYVTSGLASDFWTLRREAMP